MMIRRIDNPADGAARLREVLAQMDAKKQPAAKPTQGDDLKISIETIRGVIWVATPLGDVAQYREVYNVRSLD